MSERWDTIIVGAGPGGSALAIRLAQAGVRVLLVDRGRFPRDKLCGEFLSPECWPMLDYLGAADAVRAAKYQPIRALRLWIPGRPPLEAALPHRPGYPAVGLSRARLDDILLRRAAEAGATVAQGAQVVGVIERGGAVLGVRVRQNVACSSGARSEDRHAKVVIAADGRRSVVVRHSGRIRASRRSTPGDVCAAQRHYRVHAALDPGDSIELHSFPGGYAGTCRVEGDRVNLCTLVPRALVRRVRGDVEQALRLSLSGCRAAQWLDAIEPLSAWKTMPDVRVERAEPDRLGVLYVGDAMGTVDPLGGEGMAMALEGALLAARFVERAVGASGGCDRRVQEEYRSAWAKRFRRRTRLSSSFGWLLARPATLRPLLLPLLQSVWSRALLPLAFEATRGPCDRAHGRSMAAGTDTERHELRTVKEVL